MFHRLDFRLFWGAKLRALTAYSCYEPEHRATMRILVVEDEPRLLRSLAKALREEGYAVDTAEAGDDGLYVRGATSERVGAIAFSAGLPLSELTPQGSSLEDVFLELTTEGAS